MANRKKKKITKKQKEQRTKLISAGVVLLLVFFMGLFLGENKQSDLSLSGKIEQFKEELITIFQPEEKEEVNETKNQETTIRFLDANQGSATLIQAKDGTTILIDSGRYEDKDKKIIQQLDEYIGTGGTIDLLIFTHNDSDHIGYGDLIINYYDVKEVWMNGNDATSKIYERVLDAVDASNAVYTEPKTGEKHQVGPFQIDVLSPDEQSDNDQNDDSIVTKITVNQVSGLFSGDASQSIEKDIVESGADVTADFILMGHHGSDTSTGEEWIQASQPEFAVFSAGENNSYGHPGEEAIGRLQKLAIPVYGTIEYGTITLTVHEDGTYSIQTEKGENPDEDGA
ncbi:ComEC/Rec2 family competence protein [Carnobacterium viridans]|uniref:Metal-dependent hydrolase, beta-lactamase superfamily II n=2 Tax=Carnobacterium viridans TaxID=174587 RepID=A0A1H1BH09_9LACT|nr:MBL fold metallo-hydrolase [Carnobacterium viridans]SDQ51238.1 Metal-dependent hydrolase, beta-lactamase superfamily II [Carnobacterium viridans]